MTLMNALLIYIGIATLAGIISRLKVNELLTELRGDIGALGHSHDNLHRLVRQTLQREPDPAPVPHTTVLVTIHTHRIPAEGPLDGDIPFTIVREVTDLSQPLNIAVQHVCKRGTFTVQSFGPELYAAELDLNGVVVTDGAALTGGTPSLGIGQTLRFQFKRIA